MRRQAKKMLALILVSLFVFSIFSFSGCKPKEKPLNVIIMWHNHQPFYKNPVNGEYILPWVRLHGVKDYYRMPYIVSNYPDIKVSFDLSGSLIAQIQDYLNGARDTRGIISLMPPSQLTANQKWEMLQIPGGFFDINWDHILKKIPMYKDLLEKRQEAFKKYGTLPEDEKINKITSSFSDQYYTNLIALFNLFWMDNDYVKNNSSLKPLYNKAFNNEDYTENDVQKIMNEQTEVLKKIFPEYKELLDKNQIELVTTPYSHPISALLTDFGWNTDLEVQINKANEVFSGVFDAKPKGVWASECAINDKALKMFHNAGWNWTISDADNLTQLGVDTKKDPVAKFLPYNVDGVTVFFRDRYLSDGIGFRYSGKSVGDAVNDFTNALLNVEKQNTDGNLVYTIALDGENAWEYYNNDGNDFLNALYKKLSELQKEGKIKTITPSEYIKKFGKGKNVAEHKVTVLNLEDKDISNVARYSELPKKEIDGQFGESSWVNPTLDTWIGEKQENTGWMMLKDARKAFLLSNVNGEAKTNAEENLMRAEGSDWFWWYGSDQDSGNDKSFDRLFKMYLFEVYKLIGKEPPAYLFGNYFPDGMPYRGIAMDLEKGKYTEIPVLQNGVSIKLTYDGKSIKAIISTDSPFVKMGVFDGENISNPFFLGNGVPSEFHMNPFPYDSSNIGIPLDRVFTSFNNNGRLNGDVITINTEQLEDKKNIFIAFAGGEKSGVLSPYTIPIHVKLPLEIKGKVIGELLDDEGDDNGPGTYQYPLADVFKQAGKGLFDLISFKMLDSGDNYILQYKMANLGGNPWNGPNGISFQIIETYIDFKDGGKTSAITKGPRVQFDKSHPWDIALRIAGWSYGNYIKFADGTNVQGELSIQVDQKNNLITVAMPKKYISFSENYKPFIGIISGSQDGYSEGYWRNVGITAGEWQLGGAEAAAFNAGVSPNVCDIFTPEHLSQRLILESYDIKNKTLTTIPLLPLEKIKPVPKLVGGISVKSKKEIKEGDVLPVEIRIKNIGSGIQKDDPGRDEFKISIPEEIYLVKESLKASSGKVESSGSKILWNGSIAPDNGVIITFNVKVKKDVPNGKEILLLGKIFEDSNGDGKDDKTVELVNRILTNYPVKLSIPLNSSYFVRNGNKVDIGPIGAEFIEKWNDVGVPLGQIIKALGGTYKFDPEKKKITITFMGSKYEHWVGQNKSLLSSSAVPLYPDNPGIRSFMEKDEPIIPLKAIAYAFKLQYSFDKVKKEAYIEYTP
jgi:alpha-amylase/alpha-mannosidase (GH57 family)